MKLSMRLLSNHFLILYHQKSRNSITRKISEYDENHKRKRRSYKLRKLRKMLKTDNKLPYTNNFQNKVFQVQIIS